jgi:tight adherence protein B
VGVVTASMSQAPAIAALLGAGMGWGLVLAVFARTRRLRWPARIPKITTGQKQRLAAAISIGILTALATGWAVAAVLAAAAVWCVPRLIGRDRETAQRVARIEALATWAEMLRDTLSAAAGLQQAILAAAALAPAPIRGEVTAMADRISHGESLTVSLRTAAHELDDSTADLVISSLILATGHQTRHLSDLLGSLAQAAREQASMRMRIEAGRARTRTSVRVIVTTTLTFAVVIAVLSRPYLATYDTVTGQMVLLGAGALFVLGFFWLTRIAAFPPVPRLLAAASEQGGQE